MRKIMIAILSLLVITASALLIGCNKEGEEGLSGNLVLLDASGNTLISLRKNSVYSAELYQKANGRNVNSWSTENGVVIIDDEKVVVDNVRELLLQNNVNEITIYPTSYYTVLVDENGREYKAVENEVPKALLPSQKIYKVFEYYYMLTQDGREIVLTDEHGQFLDFWTNKSPEVHVYAKYSPAEIAVEMEYGEGVTAEEDPPKSIRIGDDVDFLKVPSCQGYDFLGWYTTDGKRIMDAKGGLYVSGIFGEEYDIQTSDKGYKVRFVARWQRKMHNLRFVYDGGVIKETTVAYDEDVPQIEFPYPYCSLVWEGADGVEVTKVPDADVTLNAKVVFHTSNGERIPWCATRVCDLCGERVEGSVPHTYETEAPCVNAPCTVCGDVRSATAEHLFDTTAPCKNKVCQTCGLTLLKTAEHSIDESKLPLCVCSTCGENVLEEISYYRTKNTVYFGEYPQQRVTDAETNEALSALYARPNPEDEGGWTPYEGTEIDGFANMWYIDVEYSSNKYRGVYVSNQNKNGYQKQNGYATSSVYWFLYLPIAWSIVEENQGVVSATCNIVLDSVSKAQLSAFEQAFLRDAFSGKERELLVSFALPVEQISAAATDYALVNGLNGNDLRVWTEEGEEQDGVGVAPLLTFSLLTDGYAVIFEPDSHVSAIYYRIGESGSFTVLDVLTLPVKRGVYVYYYAQGGYGYNAEFGADSVQNRYISKDQTVTNVPVYSVPKEVVVRLDDRGGQGGQGTMTLTFDQAVASLTVFPQKYNADFLGYYTEDGLLLIDENGAWKDVYGYTENTCLKKGEPFTVYAKWRERYMLAFSSNGGNGSMESVECIVGLSVRLPSATFTKTGYYFAGWARTARGSSVYSDNQTCSSLTDEPNSTVTLYAVWRGVSYTVKYRSNGGGGSMEDSTFIYDQTGYLRGNTFTRANYTFIGWSENASAADPSVAGGASVHNWRNTAGAVVTLYAIWLKTTGWVEYTYQNGHRDLYITDKDKNTEVVYPGLDREKLKRYGYTKLYIKIVFDAKEVNDGYQEVWVYSYQDKQIAFFKVEHGSGYKDTDWWQHNVSFTTSIDNVQADGSFWLRWGAEGTGADDWWLGYTYFEVVAKK